MTLSSGSRLGGYEVIGLLGAGGMGEVYRARDLKLGREVAIKILPQEFARDPSRVARFEREARMLAAVNHPTIASIYGAEEDGELRYIVMELVEGDTLAERLHRGALSVGESLRIGAGIAEALEVAHEKGVIHRDLKPANIKLTREGRVKVLDFGLAKAMDLPFSGDMSRSPTLVLGDSRPGDIVGTPEFMSPEQARGKETDRRTDIWAFGCILYEMLSGRRAFTGDNIPAALLAIVEQEPDWSALPARTPQPVRDLLARCLEKDPARRLRDAGDARLELEAAISGLSGSGVRVTPETRSRRWRVVLTASAALAVALTVLLLIRARAASPAAAPRGIRQLAVLPFKNLTNTAEGEFWGVGLADTVSARLFNVHGLQVVTPSAATLVAAEGNASIAAVARRLGANTLLSGTLQRESGRFRITYRIVDAQGNSIAANAIDGAELFDLQDRVANEVVRDLRLRRPAARTPTPSGLDTPAEQERYLQAVGLLQRYDRPDNVVKALGILGKLADEKPQSALIQAALARAYLNRFRWTKERDFADRAITASGAARSLDPNLPEVDIIVGETLLETGQSSAAADSFRKALASRPGDSQALLGLASATQESDPAASETVYRRAIELQPSFAAFNQFGAFYAGRGRYAEAADMLRRASAAAPDSSRALSNLGGVEVMRCNFPAAVDAFHRSLQLDPANTSAVSNLAMAQLWTGKPGEAVAALERAVKQSPNNFTIWGNLGDAYRAGGDRPKATAAYEKSVALARGKLELNPSDPDARSFLATGLARTGHTAEGLAEIAKALAIDRTDPNVLADAAVVSVLAERDAEALAFLKSAVSAGYCREIAARQPEFARLSSNPEFRSIVAAPQTAAGS